MDTIKPFPVAPNMTLLAKQLPGYNPSLDKFYLEKGDTCQHGKIDATNKLFGSVSCLVAGEWYNERDLIPVQVVKEIKPVKKVNFVVSLVMSIISVK